jgi:hypothetical protein
MRHVLSALRVVLVRQPVFIQQGSAMFNFLPKDDKFFDQLDNLARMLVSAAQQLSAILQTFPKFDSQRQEIEATQREDVGEQEPVCACSAYILRVREKSIRTSRFDRNDGLCRPRKRRTSMPKQARRGETWPGFMTKRWRGWHSYVIDFTPGWSFGEQQGLSRRARQLSGGPRKRCHAMAFALNYANRMETK